MNIAIASRRQETAHALLTAALGASVGSMTLSRLADLAAGDHPDVVVAIDATDGLAGTLGALPESSLVIAAADDAAVVEAATGIAARLRWFGLSPSAEVRAEAIDTTLAGTTFAAVADPRPGQRVRLALVGESAVPIALAALTAALELGVDASDAVAGIESVTVAAAGDMEVTRPAPGVVVINDTTDATPRSVAEALKALAQLTTDGTRSVAVLGQLELRPGLDPQEIRDEHDRIGRLVVRLNVSRLIVVGHAARHIHNAAGLEGSWNGESLLVETAEEAYAVLNESEIVPAAEHTPVVVLVKSSAASELRLLGNRIGRVTA